MNAVVISLFAALIPMIITVPIASALYSHSWLTAWKHAGAPLKYTVHSLKRMAMPVVLGLLHGLVYVLVFNKMTPAGITVSSADIPYAIAGLVAAAMVPLGIMTVWMLTRGPAAKHHKKHPEAA